MTFSIATTRVVFKIKWLDSIRCHEIYFEVATEFQHKLQMETKKLSIKNQIGDVMPSNFVTISPFLSDNIHQHLHFLLEHLLLIQHLLQ